MFQFAPADWPAFQERFGQWKATTDMINKVEDLLKGKEDDE